MCEITNGKIYVADRDLVCYKVMLEKGERLESLQRGYVYEIGREYCVKDFECRCADVVIYEAWSRSLSPFAGWKKIYTVYPFMYRSETETDLQYTHRGFYSYTHYGNGDMEWEIERRKRTLPVYELDRIKCVRCRIPEGSKYMVSDDGEVFISERIVIDDAWLL